MSISLVPDQEPVAAVVGDGIERWVFTEITKDMGLGVDFECEIHPLNVLTFQAYVLPSMGKEQAKKLPTLEVYNRAYAGRTHVKLRRGRGAKGWAVDEVASLEECRPRSQTARQVDGFGQSVAAKPAPVEPAPIRRQRVSDPILEEQGWVLSLEDDGWHALNTIRKHRAGLGYSLAAHAEEAAANLQDAFDRKVLSERDSAQSGWVDVEEGGQGSVVDGQSEDHAAAPVLSDSEADEILETAIEAVEEHVEVLELPAAAPVQTLHPSDQTTDHRPLATIPLPNGEIFLPVANIFPSPMNPRKHFDEEYIAGLAASIKESGLINAIVVRLRPEPTSHSRWLKIQPCLPADGNQLFDLVDTSDGEIALLGRYDSEEQALISSREYEIVAGECRWRAHCNGGLGRIRARIVEITDADMRIVQLEENIKRKNLTPLEEAQAFADAINSGEFTIKTLAKRASVSESQIRGTMKLLALPETARLALNTGSMAVSTAELIARRPNEDQRERLSQIVIAEGLSYGQVKKLIETDFSRELKGAAFELEDPDLIPAAGACTTCVYRSGNDRETYPDGRDDVCNSPSCYSAKEAAFWQLRTIAEERAMEEYTDDRKTDPAVVEESPRAANAWEETFSDGSKTFAPDQPKELPAEPTEESQGILLASDSDELDDSTGELEGLDGVAGSTVERWVIPGPTMYQNGQLTKTGELCEIRQLTEATYQQWVLLMLPETDQRSMPNLRDWLGRFPSRTHFFIKRSIGSEGWEFGACRALEACRPMNPPALRVEQFGDLVEPVKSQPEQAATAEIKTSSAPHQNAKSAPAVSSSSASAGNGFPTALSDCRIEVNLFVYPPIAGVAGRQGTIGARHSADSSWEFDEVSATGIADLARAVEKAIVGLAEKMPDRVKASPASSKSKTTASKPAGKAAPKPSAKAPAKQTTKAAPSKPKAKPAAKAAKKGRK